MVAHLHNWDSAAAHTGTVRAVLGGQHVCTRTHVAVPAGASVPVALTPAECPALVLARPALWWPYQMGTPHTPPPRGHLLR